MKFYIIAFAFVSLAAADVSHLKLGLSVDGGYGLSGSASAFSGASSSAEVVPGGDSSSYQPAEYTPEHLQTAEVVSGGDSVAAEVIPGGDSSSYTPAEVETSVPAAIGADTYTPEKFISQEVQEEEAVVPGGDSSSYQPAEYTPEHLQTAEVVSGGDSVAAEVIPGGDSSSYQPAEYTPAEVETSVPAAIGADTYAPVPVAIGANTYAPVPVAIGADSYAPVPVAIGADTYTPEKFIPQEVQEQAAVVPAGDSSADSGASEGDSTSYQSAVSQTTYAQEVGSSGSFYQNAQPIAAYVQAQAPVVVVAKTIPPPLLQTTYYSSGQETQYASNGGYVY